MKYALKYALSLAIVAACAAVHAEGPVRFIQDEFCISFFIDPPMDENADANYKDIADANFNVVLGITGFSTPEKLKEQVALCAKFGLKDIVGSAGLPDDQLPNDANVWGYFIRDEPSAKDFPALRERVDALRAARPGKLGYINLFPSYCDLPRLGTASYEEHVQRYMDEVDPDVLCMDHYPFMRPDKDTREDYIKDVETMRVHALAKNVPWWNYFNIMPFGPHRDPTEAQVRWQIFTSVAYGAKGVLYFCYWTPRGGEFDKGGAVITSEGQKTRHYGQAKRVNAQLKAWGPDLMRLHSDGAKRIVGGKEPDASLQDTPIRSISEGDYEAGLFHHVDGHRALILVNHDMAFTTWPTVQFDVPDDRVLEVDSETGETGPARDDSPTMPGLQLSFDAGDARFFLLPAEAGYLPK